MNSDPELMEWGDLATAARAAGSLAPAWKKFIKTKFFVPILRSPDNNPKNFLLCMARDAVLTISEVRARLDEQQSDGIVSLSGGDILRRIEDQGRIEVVLRDGVFSISKKRVDWLRSGIKVATARVATKKALTAAAPAAPLPVLKVASASALAPAAKAPLRSFAPVLKFRYVIPVLLSIAAIGILVTVVIPIMSAPADTDVQAPPAAPVPAPVGFDPPPPAPSPVLPAAAAPQPSVTFTPSDNSFTVNLPGLAEEVELSPDQVNQTRGIDVHQYKLQLGDWMYTLEASDYGAHPPKDRAAAMDILQESVVGKDGTLLAAKPVYLRGTVGREVRVRLSNGGERAARFALIRSKLCMVKVTAPSGERSAAQVDAFLNSFQLN